MSETAAEPEGTTENPPEKESECQQCNMHEIREMENQSSWNAQKSLLWQALPLILLLLFSLLAQNISSILLFVALIVTFDTVNDFVARNAERSRDIPLAKILLTMGYMVGIIALSYPVILSHWLMCVTRYHYFHLWWTTNVSFWHTLFVITVMDFVFKYVTMVFKCCLLICGGKMFSVCKRGKALMFIEGLSQLIRCLLPVPEWGRYFLKCDLRFSSFICWILLVFYVYLKFKAIRKKLPLVVNAFKYKTLTGADINPAGTDDITAIQEVKLCPICHENFVEPVKTPCGHIFCAGCISIWFDREQHCPKCSTDAINSLILGLQAAVPPSVPYTNSNSKWKTGATDYVIQFF